MESTRRAAVALGVSGTAVNVAVTLRTLVTRLVTTLVDPAAMDGRDMDGRLRSAGVVHPGVGAGPQLPHLALTLAGRPMFAGLAAAQANFAQSSKPESKTKPGFSILSALTWPAP
jgi:hypothetical protein